MSAEGVAATMEMEALQAEIVRIQAENVKVTAENVKVTAENVKVTARLCLFSTSGSSCGDLFELLELIGKCDLDPLPLSYLDDYIRVSNDSDTSGTYVRLDKSSVTSQNSAGNLPLQKIRRHMTQNTDSEVALRALALDEVDLEGILCSALFGEDESAFNAFVAEQVDVLGKLRQALFHLGRRRDSVEPTSVREVSELQPIALLYLEEQARRFHHAAHISPAQAASERLSGEIFVGTSKETQTKQNVSGFADLIARSSEHDGTFLFLVELKAPFSDLRHSGAFAAKDQLVFELELFATMECNNRPALALGGLLDMNTIGVAARKEENGVATFYMSPRVTEPRAFVLRTLLLLCGDKDAVWEQILPLSTREVELPDDLDFQRGGLEEGAVDEDGSDDPDAQRDKENAADGGSAYIAMLATTLKAMRASEGNKKCARDVRDLLAWDSNRRTKRHGGLSTLTVDALNAHKSQHPDRDLHF